MTLSSFYKEWVSQSSESQCHREIVIYSWIGWRGVGGIEGRGERDKWREGEWMRTLHSGMVHQMLVGYFLRNWCEKMKQGMEGGWSGQCSWPNHTLCKYFIQVSVISSWGLPDKGMKQQEPRSMPPPRTFSELLPWRSFSPWSIFNLRCHHWGALMFMTFIAF